MGRRLEGIPGLSAFSDVGEIMNVKKIAFAVHVYVLLVLLCTGCRTNYVVPGEQLGDTGTEQNIQKLTEQQGTSIAASTEIAGELEELARILKSGESADKQYFDIISIIQNRSPVRFEYPGAGAGGNPAESAESKVKNTEVNNSNSD